jgi:hypothetical protein
MRSAAASRLIGSSNPIVGIAQYQLQDGAALIERKVRDSLTVEGQKIERP